MPAMTAMCVNCNDTYGNHLGDSCPNHTTTFTERTTLMPAFPGQILPNDTVAAANLVGVGGSFRADNDHARVYTVIGHRHTESAEHAVVRDNENDVEFPIVHQIWGADHLVVVSLPTVTTTDGRSIDRPADNVECGNCSGSFASHADNGMRCPDGRQQGFRQWGTNDELAYTSAPETTIATTESDSPAIPAQPLPIVAGHVIPRTLDELAGMRATAEATLELFPGAAADVSRYMRGLDNLAEWLHGGKKQRAGHSLAGCEDPDVQAELEAETGVYSIGLCGEYENIVCPVLGWIPRRGEGSSMMSRVETWRQSIDRFEQDRAHLNAYAILEAWLDNYAAGGVFNTAVTDHMRSNLESHKVEDANALLEQLGWEPMPVMGDYLVRVRVERPVTTTEYGYATVSVRALDPDDAVERVSDTYSGRDLASYVDDWTPDDYSWDSDDYSAEADFDGAEAEPE